MNNNKVTYNKNSKSAKLKTIKNHKQRKVPQQKLMTLRAAKFVQKLKVNACKYCFCVMETEYLGYILSLDVIKPQPKKVQAILTLTLPQNVKQLCRFLGMVQY